MNQQSDFYRIISFLFQQFVKLTQIIIPGTSVTYFTFFMFIAVAILSINFVKKLISSINSGDN